MSGIDLGQYKSDYSNIFPVKKNTKGEAENIEEDSPIKLYEAEKKGSKEIVFLKLIDKEALEEEEDYEFHLEHIQKEKEISLLCNSEYTVKLNRYFETEKSYVFEKEYCETDLREKLFNDGHFENNSTKNDLQTFKGIVIDLANALKLFKEKGVVHRNIKPHNIYLKELDEGKYRAKLTDFSCAIYIKDIKDSEPMGTILYTAPELIKNLDYTEKCDLWSVGVTLFEIYFGVLPYGYNANTKKINEIIYGEKNFIFRKSGLTSLDILFKSLLQIDPEKRMSHEEFYNYVTNPNFLNPELEIIIEDEKYYKLYQEIESEQQVKYEPLVKKESLNTEEAEKQSIEKIFEFVEEGNLPDIMSFSNASVNNEEKFNNIIYYDTNIEKHKNDIHGDSDSFERETPGAFILCSNLKSLSIIKDEIVKYRRADKKVIFNIISNGGGFKHELKQFLDANEDFRKCINKVCIFCIQTDRHIKLKNDYPNLIYEVTNTQQKVINFIKDLSSKDIKPFPLTKLVRLNDYLDKYKERHAKISQYYGDLKAEDFKKNLDEIDKIIDEDEKKKKLKKDKSKIRAGLLSFNIEKDLEALDELIIKEYTKNTFYGDLNRWLMKSRKKYYEPVAYFTSRLMYSLNKYAEKHHKFCQEDEKILHRGTKLFYSCLLPYERAVGKEILLSAFTSTSESDFVARTWAGRGKEREIYENSSKFSVVFHIKNKYKNPHWVSNSIDIQEESDFKKEKEILFQPFSFYKVTNVNINIDNYTADISLETIGKREILEERIKEGKNIRYNQQENIMEAY